MAMEEELEEIVADAEAGAPAAPFPSSKTVEKATGREVSNIIDLKQLKQDVTLLDNQLDNALTVQPGLAVHYGMLLSKAQFQYDSRKNELELVEARVASTWREKWDSKGEKYTEKRLEAAVVMAQEVQDAKANLNKARVVLDLARTAQSALEQRYQMVIQKCKRAELELNMRGSLGSTQARLDRFLDAKKP